MGGGGRGRGGVVVFLYICVCVCVCVCVGFTGFVRAQEKGRINQIEMTMIGESAMTMVTSLILHEKDAKNYEMRDGADSIEFLSVEFCELFEITRLDDFHITVPHHQLRNVIANRPDLHTKSDEERNR